jgi:hypothetical protein
VFKYHESPKRNRERWKKGVTVGFEVLADVTMKRRIIWVVMRCGFVASITT